MPLDSRYLDKGSRSLLVSVTKKNGRPLASISNIMLGSPRPPPANGLPPPKPPPKPPPGKVMPPPPPKPPKGLPPLPPFLPNCWPHAGENNIRLSTSSAKPLRILFDRMGQPHEGELEPSDRERFTAHAVQRITYLIEPYCDSHVPPLQGNRAIFNRSLIDELSRPFSLPAR